MKKEKYTVQSIANPNGCVGFGLLDKKFNDEVK